jgi:hypothetical protein
MISPDESAIYNYNYPKPLFLTTIPLNCPFNWSINDITILQLVKFVDYEQSAITKF